MLLLFGRPGKRLAAAPSKCVYLAEPGRCLLKCFCSHVESIIIIHRKIDARPRPQLGLAETILPLPFLGVYGGPFLGAVGAADGPDAQESLPHGGDGLLVAQPAVDVVHGLLLGAGEVLKPLWPLLAPSKYIGSYMCCCQNSLSSLTGGCCWL